jgi:serine/threonine protein kinase
LTYFSEELSRHCILQVAKGIHFLHEEKGVVHRDIKPENLLFDKISFRERTTPLPAPHPDDEEKEDEGEFMEGVGGGGIGRVRIADFGLSKVIWDKQTTTPCGTVGYTAPEIVRDERYSKSVDMWALGCVLYTLLCGFPPFYDESIQTLTQKVAKGEFEFLSPWWDEISPDAKDLISHLLTVDPEERYTIVQFLDHPWIKNEPKLPHAKEVILPTTTEETLAVSTASSPTLGSLIMTPLSAEKSTTGAISSPRPIKVAAAPSTNVADQPDRRHDVASPTLTSMKEVFDVSYAVHRIAEETARRKALAASNANRQSAAFSPLHALNNIDEDDDDEAYGLTTDNSDSSQSADSGEESDHHSIAAAAAATRMTNNVKVQMDNLRLKNPPTQRLQQSQRERVAAHLKGPASPKLPVDRTLVKTTSKKIPFELKIGNATLLEKRKQRELHDAPAVQG